LQDKSAGAAASAAVYSCMCYVFCANRRMSQQALLHLALLSCRPWAGWQGLRGRLLSRHDAKHWLSLGGHCCGMLFTIVCYFGSVEIHIAEHAAPKLEICQLTVEHCAVLPAATGPALPMLSCWLTLQLCC
jgi:hypothetical protein